nr:basic proline-rich protein-like [Macaca nemestrina]
MEGEGSMGLTKPGWQPAPPHSVWVPAVWSAQPQGPPTTLAALRQPRYRFPAFGTETTTPAPELLKDRVKSTWQETGSQIPRRTQARGSLPQGWNSAPWSPPPGLQPPGARPPPRLSPMRSRPGDTAGRGDLAGGGGPGAGTGEAARNAHPPSRDTPSAESPGSIWLGGRAWPICGTVWSERKVSIYGMWWLLRTDCSVPKGIVH